MSQEIRQYEIEVVLLEPMLGTVPMSKELYESIIAPKAPKGIDIDEEIEAVPEAEEKGMTGFCRCDGQPAMLNYLVKGYCKDVCGMLRRAEGTLSSRVKAHKKTIDGLLFVRPRFIIIDTSKGAYDLLFRYPGMRPPTMDSQMWVLERPLRAQTPQGERTALAYSEVVPARSRMRFTIQILGGIGEELLIEWLEYGQYRGFGSFRNADWGSFTYTIEPSEPF